ncbi:MAG: TlpA family protein disulfide reductase [Gammaproteobacteria bacterium]|jgi:cytochrome c biogenesis protein CcmG/thiol:disulfide interchange protein DsbE|nr:TlpA family protein disulfide reductase [Gammaproteobacteria bacterium]
MKPWLLLFSVLSLATSSFAASAIEISSLAGSPVKTDAELAGKVVIVDFWASWCGPCRKSFPFFNELQQKHQAAGLVVLAVNEDEERSDAEAFLKQYPASFAVLFDKEGQLASQYQIPGMPTTVVIDRNGKIRYSHSGFFESKTAAFEQEIQQLLQEEVTP